MTEADPDTGPFAGDDAGGSREYGRLLLTLAAAAAVVFATLFVPVLTGGGAGGGPAGALVPNPPGATPPPGSGGDSEGSLGSGFGALDPGQSTDVGGDKSAFRDQTPGTHFVVESPQPGYWRTGTYATYTGRGWERSEETTAIDGPVRDDRPRRATVSYTVELKRAAGSLPTMFRPQRVELGAGSVDLRLTEGRAVRTGQQVGFGTRYEATSARPVDDPAVLRGAGRDYPAAVEDRYTQLPASTRERLGPLVDRISDEANAETAYGTAKAVETWIRTEKTYSLDVPAPSDDVATQAVFELDRVYCELAATSMVAMLRARDIPARYVVGYSTGRQVGPDRYQVLSMNAHAWVEVYFPEVGWVRFDPTPPDARRAAEERSFENQTDMEYQQDITPTPTPTPTATPVEVTPTPTPTPGDGSDGEAGYRVRFNRSLAPGATVEATVLRDGRRQAGVTVLFDDRAIGETGPAGTVVGQVPYSRNVTVRVRDGSAPLEAVAGPPDRSRFGSLPPPGGGPRDAETPPTVTTQSDDDGSVAGTYELPTEGNLSLSGELVTTGEVVVTATVAGTPIRDAPVRVNGTTVARTNRRGQATVSLPAEPGNTTVLVRRGEVTASRNVTLPELELSVATSVALPGSPATADVRLGNRTAGDATVSAGGSRVGGVGPNGTVAFAVPLGLSPTVTATGYGQTASVTLSGVGTNLAGLGLGLALLAGLAVLTSRRTGLSLQGLAARALALVGRLPDLAAALVVRIGTTLERLAVELVALPGRAADFARDLLAGRRTPTDLAAAARGWLTVRTRAVRERLDRARARSERAIGGTSEDGAEVTLGQAWRRFLGTVSVRDPESRTPGELARHAVEADGLPRDAVRTLRDDYRAVEYGARDPSDRLERVEAALDEVERAVDGASEGRGTAEGGGDGDGGANGADRGDDDRRADGGGEGAGAAESPTGGGDG